MSSGNFATLVTASSSNIEPVLEITLAQTPDVSEEPPAWLPSNELNLSGGVAFARGKAYNPVVMEWGDLSRGFDTRGSDLQPLEVTITLADADGDIQRMLEIAQQRGSMASIYYVVPGSADDYQQVFSGILERWGYKSGGITELTLRTDDSLLRTYIP